MAKERQYPIPMPAERRRTSAGRILCHKDECRTVIRNPNQALYCCIHEEKKPRGDVHVEYHKLEKRLRR